MQNRAMDATAYGSTIKPQKTANTFGGSLGGPIKRNRAFFLGTYEDMRYHTGTTLQATVPTEAIRRGDISAHDFVTEEIRLALYKSYVWWPLGARHFLRHLIDGDIACNNHGWQWVAGTGTDASPYFRVFNPVTQGLRFDPHGDYVRRYVPELAHLAGKAAHEPWKHADGYAQGYPERVVDHAEERREALRRYEAARG
jgi:hypothetical protein